MKNERYICKIISIFSSALDNSIAQVFIWAKLKLLLTCNVTNGWKAKVKEWIAHAVRILSQVRQKILNKYRHHLPNRFVHRFASIRCGGLPATLSDDGRDFAKSKVGWLVRPIECSRRPPNRDSIAVVIWNCYNNAITLSMLVIVFFDIRGIMFTNKNKKDMRLGGCTNFRTNIYMTIKWYHVYIKHIRR